MARVTHRFYQTLWALWTLKKRGLTRLEDPPVSRTHDYFGSYPADIYSRKEFNLAKRVVENNLAALVEEGLVIDSGVMYFLSKEGESLADSLFDRGVNPVKDWSGDKTRYKKDVVVCCTAALARQPHGEWVDINTIMEYSRMSRSAIRSTLSEDMDRHSHGKEDGVTSRYLVTSGAVSLSEDESAIRVNPDYITAYLPDTEPTKDTKTMTPPELLPEEDAKTNRQVVKIFSQRIPKPSKGFVEMSEEDVTLDRIFQEVGDSADEESPAFTEDDLWESDVDVDVEPEPDGSHTLHLEEGTRRRLEALALLTGKDVDTLASALINKGLDEATRTLNLGD